jgi:hypothetical protein
MSAESDYLAWRGKPPVGCVFARLLARRPKGYPQRIETIASGRSPNQVAAYISQRIDAVVADTAIHAATLLFPGLKTLEQTARTMLALKQFPNWSVSTNLLKPPPSLSMVTVHVVRQIPFGTSMCPSEALVLGPFKEFPSTRRSPIVALEIFIGEPLANDPKTGTPTTKANLAHFKMNSLSDAAYDKTWENSIKGRTKSLGGIDDNRAKAKVSFVIPTVMAQRLGYEP